MMMSDAKRVGPIRITVALATVGLLAFAACEAAPPTATQTLSDTEATATRQSSDTEATARLVEVLKYMSTDEVAAQVGIITGQVTDGQSGTPIAAVQVYISSLDLGGLTQQNGRYLLQYVPAGSHTLTVARIGYVTTQIEIVVRGDQTVQQDLTISKTNGVAETPPNGPPVTRVTATKVDVAAEVVREERPDMAVVERTALGDGPEPLIYLDGIRIGYTEGGVLDMLNPDDIESIEIIKGGAAEALYGSIAAGGVIQIVTKRE